MLNLFNNQTFFLSIISLFVGTSLFLIRNSIFTIISKIKRSFTLFIETILFKIPGFKSFYNQGYFLFYWTVCWLVCRFTIIAPINIFLISDNDFIITLVIIRLISIVIALIIALIPTVLLTRNQHINDIITGLHYSYCTQEPWFLNMILRIHVIKCAIYHSKIRLFIAFLAVFTVFMFYLFTGDKLFLIIFLLIMYSRLYSQNFISKVIPGLDLLSEFSYTIPHGYFLASYKYRYWKDTTPNNPIEDVEDPDYFFTAIHRDEYLNLEQLYLDTLFVDMVNDPSLNPHEKLRYYNEIMKHRDPGKTSIFLDTIKEEISDLNKLKSSTKNCNSHQKKSFHTTRRVAALDEDDTLIDLLGTRSPASTPPATPRAETTAELSVCNKTVGQSSVARKSEFPDSKRLVTDTKLWKKLTGYGDKKK